MIKKILIVDDSPNDVFLIRKALKECWGEHELHVAVDGVEGLFFLETKNFDIVLLDIKMPLMGGFDLLQHIRETDPLSRLAVIVVSGSNMRSDRIRASALGVEQYVHKAMDYKIFKQDIYKALCSTTSVVDIYDEV